MRQRSDWNLVDTTRKLPCVIPARRMDGRRCDHIPAVAADIEPWPKLPDGIRHVNSGPRVLEVVVPAPAAGEHHRGIRQLGQPGRQRFERFVPTVAWVHVQNDDVRNGAGRDPDIRLRPPPPPIFM